MQFTPYLNFDGHCAEALAFYARLFQGTIVHQSTFGEIPPSEGMPPIPESARSRIMHAHLQIKDQALMGSDAMPGADATCGGYRRQLHRTAFHAVSGLIAIPWMSGNWP